MSQHITFTLKPGFTQWLKYVPFPEKMRISIWKSLLFIHQVKNLLILCFR
ncbi:MAG: hypothetical protein K0R76_1380 [Alphaproteobacteria bacterium]|jgi:hypothetical protein|nr:hypothetical protein [Alphaproteobacteria bacterium]MDF3034426.1 hypothetical protein [Alphaproteobacteria bacterium]